MQQIKAEVRTFIVDNFIMGGDGAKFKDSDSFMAKHVIDSTGFLELVSFLEQKYSIVIDDNDLIPENLDSLDNIATYVARKLPA